jgi:hypothetical protein
MTMKHSPSTAPEELRKALLDMLRSPIKTLVPPWSWKAAAFSAVVRAAAFFGTNLRAGRYEATKAMIVEAVFAIFAGGLIGAISQHLRRAKPLWVTALLVCAGLPAIMILAQLGVHHIARTPHQSGGVITSFFLAGIAAAYVWYAMRRGAMLGGSDETTIRNDLRSLPRISVDFLLVFPRLVTTKLQQTSRRD